MVLDVGHNVWPHISWAEVADPSTGMFLVSSITKHGTWPESFAFVNIFLTTCTYLSAMPLDLGYPGLLVTSWNLHHSSILLKLLDEYCVPLSLLTTSGIPDLENIISNFRITDTDFVLYSRSVSRYLLW